jgi:hypothetical protein
MPQTKQLAVIHRQCGLNLHRAFAMPLQAPATLPQFGAISFGVGTMTLKTILRQNRTHLAIEINLSVKSRAAGSPHQQRQCGTDTIGSGGGQHEHFSDAVGYLAG